MTNRIRWLHISDLHLGCSGRGLWWQNEKDFEKSIGKLVEESGPPDLVLLTGDLAFKGAGEEYELVDAFLDEVLKWTGNAGSKPVLLAVPGNHDLARPGGMDALKYIVLDNFHRERDDPNVIRLMDSLWEGKIPEKKKAAREFFDPLFGQYRGWFERRIRPQLEERAESAHFSHFPCDFTAELELNGFRLAVVGLNSAWLQYDDKDFKRKLAIPVEQFHAALPVQEKGNPLARFERCDGALVLMHHPPTWLSNRARKTFMEEIYPPDRFALCLFGHQHAGRAETVLRSGGKPRYYFQAPSLFGIEHHGASNETRSMGYACGSLARGGKVWVRPFERVPEVGYVDDRSFPEREGGEKCVQIAPVAVVKAETPDTADMAAYFEGLASETGFIKIRGIGSGAGKVKNADQYPIERLYTPLRSRAPLKEDREGERPQGGERIVPLREVLAGQQRLLIEGQPGAGKTTFLMLVASCLARDSLDIECPEGVPWRKHYLDLEVEKPPLPVFIRIADLTPVLTDEKRRAGRPDDRTWLIDLLENRCKDMTDAPSRKQWDDLLQSGKAMVLLDGLDEVGDERLRDRVFDIFRDTCKHWSRCRIVVSSRPIQTRALEEMDFHRTTIEDFGREEITRFIDLWVGALYKVEPGDPLDADGEKYRQELLSAIVDMPRVRRIAVNPVMLTCLCVVHWNEGRLPDGRSRVYRAVLRWLIASRTKKRKKAGFTDRFAELALARLALEMMKTTAGKQATIALQDAAEALDSVVERAFPDSSPAGRLNKARDWLRFETELSSIIEEIDGHRLRFWHLTFQEHLAARQLALLGEGEDPEEDWWPIVKDHLDDKQWRETIDMVPGCLFDAGGEGRVDRLLERVLDESGENPDLAREARIVGIMGRLLRPLEVFGYKQNQRIMARYGSARDRTMAIFEKEGAGRVRVEERINAAEALGRSGDPRFNRVLENIDDHTLPVPGADVLRLGKYPVTVGEFKIFQEGDGYENSRYWDDVGWAIREEEDWQAPGGWEKQLEIPNRPVVQVSWYEVKAYCRWLEGRIGSRLDFMVKLPEEREWVAAATPRKGEYPWGEEEPDPELANFGNSVGGPTPVGIYPAGAGPCGHLDLAGNVWEWCEDEVEWDESMERFVRDVLERQPYPGETGRALRGGCFWNDAVSLRVSARDWAPAGGRGGNVGFRVAVAPAST